MDFTAELAEIYTENTKGFYLKAAKISLFKLRIPEGFNICSISQSHNQSRSAIRVEEELRGCSDRIEPRCNHSKLKEDFIRKTKIENRVIFDSCGKRFI